MSVNFSTLLYLVSAVCFILALSGLSSPTKARSGNMFGIAGMAIAIEPMINLGVKEIVTDNDGWTIRTADGKTSAHFEHTITITSDEAIILSKKSELGAQIES